MKQLIAFLFFASVASAQMVTVGGTITNASGATFTGTVRVILRYASPMTTTSGTTITPVDRTYTITSGVISPTMTLTANDAIVPSGTYYEARFVPATGVSWLEYWVIPSSPSSTTPGAIRSGIVPNPRFMVAPSQITSGGATSPTLLYWSGASWIPMSRTGSAAGMAPVIQSDGTLAYAAVVGALSASSPITYSGGAVGCATCVVTSGSYANPSWIASIEQAVVTGLVTALSGKEPTISAGTTGQYWRGDKSWQTLDKTAVGLSNVDNTSNATERAATATLTNKTLTLPILTQYTVATLPAFGTAGRKATITDGLAENDCITGGGGYWVDCVDTGSAWVHPGGGGGGSGTITDVTAGVGIVVAMSGTEREVGLDPDWPSYTFDIDANGLPETCAAGSWHQYTTTRRFFDCYGSAVYQERPTFSSGVLNLAGEAIMTAGLPVIGDGGGKLALGTRSGNTTEYATVTGTKTASKQLAFDGDGNVVASAYDVGAAGGGTTELYTGSIDFASIPDGSCAQGTFTATGLTTGTALGFSMPAGLDTGLFGTAFASAADTAAVRLCNLSGAAIDPANATFTVRDVGALGYHSDSSAINFGAIADGACASSTFTLAGAATNDSIAPGWPSALETGLVGAMYVSAPDTITVRLCNWSGASVDPASGTFKAALATTSPGVTSFGDPTVNGSWRIVQSGANLLVQVRTGGVWVTSGTFTP